MAPSWSSLRLGRPSEKDLRTRRSMDPGGEKEQQSVGSEEPSSSKGTDVTPASPVSPRRNHRTRDSVVSLSAVNDPPPTMGQLAPPSVPILELPEDDKVPHRPHRFSLMRFRHASDSQLNKTAKEQDSTPPMPGDRPTIVRTAPTAENLEVQDKRRSTFSFPQRHRDTSQKPSHESLHGDRDNQATPVPTSRVTFEGSRSRGAPPPYGEEQGSTLALPSARMSESSRSDASSNDHGIYAQTTTTHTVSTTTTFFKIPRRRKDKGPLFPLPPKSSSNLNSVTNTPRLSSARSSESPARRSLAPSQDASGRPEGGQSPLPKGGVRRSASRTSIRSRASSLGRPKLLGQRGRSSTKSSFHPAGGEDEMPTPPVPHSIRTSTSTTGRPSLGGLFSMSRLKQGDSTLGRGLRNGDPGTPGSVGSKDHSLQIAREPQVVIPERQEGDTPAKYLARLEEVVNQGALVTILSKSEDEFMRNVLRSYVRRFKFFEDPLDIAVRKLLMHVELPKETQQIDRTLQSFADRYHECNPGVFASADDAYFVAFSILILHTDVFNKNNKHKMTKTDYVRNARSQGGCAPEILECFYDNTAYTTFIHLEDDAHFSSERLMTQKTPRKGALKVPSTPLKRQHSGPVDPYALILDNQLEALRPQLDDILVMDDSFSFLAPQSTFNIPELNRAFFRSGVLQILSQRSRPGAFANQATITNPTEAQVGVVDIKVTKVGMLWRKDPKKKKTRSPWQEWGAVLTGSQLYFFRNTSWAKNLMHQYEHHQKSGRGHSAVIFKPPLEQFKPDFLISMDHAIALIDSRYKKHKHAFLFTRHDTFSEVFLADNEAEMKDWIAKLNYAATYRTTGVRMRGISADTRKSHEGPRTASNASEASAIEKSEGASNQHLKQKPEELTQEQQIMIARKQIMEEKVHEAEDRIMTIEKSLDALLRTARHIKLLTPIQFRSREDVIVAAGRLNDVLRLTQIEKWRFKCHRQVLSLDLVEDLKSQTDQDRSVDGDSKIAVSPSATKESKEGRMPFPRFNSKNKSEQISKLRPPSMPAGAKLFSMDDIFRTPSRLKSQTHRSKGSWELPPINFDRRKSTSQTRASKDKSVDEVAVEDSDGPESLPIPSKRSMELRRASSEAALPSVSMDKDEHDVLVQAGVLAPSIEKTAPSPKFEQQANGKAESESGKDAESKTAAGDGDALEEEAGIADIDDKETRRKVRHSLQRKLQVQNAHIPGSHHHHHHHHGSTKRRNRDSNSTITAGTDDGSNPSVHDGEGLARGTGSFTVHGKKASVVQISGDWVSMGLKRAPTDSSKVESGAAGGESVVRGGSVASGGARGSVDGAVSVRSGSTGGNTEPYTATADLRSPRSGTTSDAVTVGSFQSASSSLTGNDDLWDRGRTRRSADLSEDGEISPGAAPARTRTIDEQIEAGEKEEAEAEEEGKGKGKVEEVE